MALPLLRSIASNWAVPGDLPRGSTDEESAASASFRESTSAHSTSLETFRRDVQLGAEQQQLQQRGPVGSRIVELAQMEGPVSIKRIANAPRPVALVNALSGPAPPRRPVTALEEVVAALGGNREGADGGSGGGGSAGSGSNEAYLGGGAASPREPPAAAVSPGPLQPDVGVQAKAGIDCASGQEEAAAGSAAEDSRAGGGPLEAGALGRGAPGHAAAGVAISVAAAAAASPLQLIQPQLQMLFEQLAQSRDAQASAEASCAAHAAQLAIVRTELHRTRAAGEKDKGRAAAAVAHAEAGARAANDAAAAAQERRDKAEALVKKQASAAAATAKAAATGSGEPAQQQQQQSRRTSRANSVSSYKDAPQGHSEGMGAGTQSAQVQTSPARFTHTTTTTTTTAAAASPPPGGGAALTGTCGSSPPGAHHWHHPHHHPQQASHEGSAAGIIAGGATSEHATHRRVVSDYETRVARLTASFIAARDGAAAQRSQILSLRSEVERLGGEVLSVGTLALAAGAKAKEAEAALATAHQVEAELRLRIQTLEDAFEASARRENALSSRGVGVSWPPLSHRINTSLRGGAAPPQMEAEVLEPTLSSFTFALSPRPSSSSSSAFGGGSLGFPSNFQQSEKAGENAVSTAAEEYYDTRLEAPLLPQSPLPHAGGSTSSSSSSRVTAGYLGASLASGFMRTLGQGMGGAVEATFSGAPQSVAYSATVTRPSLGVMAYRPVSAAVASPFYAASSAASFSDAAAAAGASHSALFSLSPSVVLPLPRPGGGEKNVLLGTGRKRVLKGEIPRALLLSPMGAALAHIVGAVPAHLTERIGAADAVQRRDTFAVNSALRGVQTAAAMEVERAIKAAAASAIGKRPGAAASSSLRASTAPPLPSSPHGRGGSGGAAAPLPPPIASDSYAIAFALAQGAAGAAAGAGAALEAFSAPPPAHFSHPLATRTSRLRAAAVAQRQRQRQHHGTAGGAAAAAAEGGERNKFLAAESSVEVGSYAASAAATRILTEMKRAARPGGRGGAPSYSSTSVAAAGAAAAAHDTAVAEAVAAASPVNSSLEAVATWHPAAIPVNFSGEVITPFWGAAPSAPASFSAQQPYAEVESYSRRPPSEHFIAHHQQQQQQHANSPSLLVRSRLAAASALGAPPPQLGSNSLEPPLWALSTGWTQGFSGLVVDPATANSLISNASLARASQGRPLAVIRPLASSSISRGGASSSANASGFTSGASSFFPQQHQQQHQQAQPSHLNAPLPPPLPATIQNRPPRATLSQAFPPLTLVMPA